MGIMVENMKSFTDGTACFHQGARERPAAHQKGDGGMPGGHSRLDERDRRGTSRDGRRAAVDARRRTAKRTLERVAAMRGT